MLRLAPIVLVLLVGTGHTTVHAQDFTIEINAQVGKDGKTAEAKYPKGARPRPLLTVNARAAISVKWTVRNAGKETVKDALVHFVVVKIAKPDQDEVPKLNKNVVVETALTMDFKALDKADGEITFAAPAAGVYLIRLEIKGTAAQTEPFAALDLMVP
jgi:hypothetical protein